MSKTCICQESLITETMRVSRKQAWNNSFPKYVPWSFSAGTLGLLVSDSSILPPAFIRLSLEFVLLPFPLLFVLHPFRSPPFHLWFYELYLFHLPHLSLHFSSLPPCSCPAKLCLFLFLLQFRNFIVPFRPLCLSLIPFSVSLSESVLIFSLLTSAPF